MQFLLTPEGNMIPASFGVMDGNLDLPVDLLETVDGGFQLRRALPQRELEGTYYFVGNVHRHFGHNLVEGVARAWALDYLTSGLRDGVRYVVYEESLSDYSRVLLRLAGIPEDRIVHASPHDVIERLIVPDVSMRTHR